MSQRFQFFFVPEFLNFLRFCHHHHHHHSKYNFCCKFQERWKIMSKNNFFFIINHHSHENTKIIHNFHTKIIIVVEQIPNKKNNNKEMTSSGSEKQFNSLHEIYRIVSHTVIIMVTAHKKKPTMDIVAACSHSNMSLYTHNYYHYWISI